MVSSINSFLSLFLFYLAASYKSNSITYYSNFSPQKNYLFPNMNKQPLNTFIPI